MRLVIWLIAFLFASSASAETARIAAWNLGGFHQIPQSKLDKIIEGIEKLDADIVVLPELNPLSHAQAIATKLSEPAGKCYSSATKDQPRASQEIGFVFKCDVDVSDPEFILGSDLDKQGYRSAAIATVKIGSFDFVLVGLHLKASRGSKNRALRDQQARVISAFIQGLLMGSEKDVIVIGDYNMIPGEDAQNFGAMNATGSLRFVSSEDLAGEFTHIKRDCSPGNLLDGYAFTNVDTSEYVEDTLEIINMHDELGLTLCQYKNQVTDNLPVVAEFMIDVDHD